jgi:GT2 family glycosyltransferase
MTQPVPLVSVVIIFLDAAKYIAEAIDSVRAQTLTSWELVLVDDGSTDGSSEIALRYATEDAARIRVVAHPGRRNLGTGPSRNLGMKTARGRYVAFLDADDVYEPTRLERPAELLEADPLLGVVISRELYWRSWRGPRSLGERLTRMPDEVVGPSAPPRIRIPPPVLLATTLATPGAAMPGICSITFRRDAVLELGGIPEQFHSQYEDQALIAKLLLHSPVMVLQDCLARYRQHPESLTFKARLTGEYRPGRPHAQRSMFVAWLLEYAHATGVAEPLLLQALSAELAEAGDEGHGRLAAGKKALRRLALITANAILPQRVADGIIRWHLAHSNGRIDKLAARHSAELGMPWTAKPGGSAA